MSKVFIYTVTSKRTGDVVVEGPLGKCEEVTGLKGDTLRAMALDRRDARLTPGRRRYRVTRERREREQPHGNAKYYSVYSKKTDELLACGTSAECAEEMGWSGLQTLHRVMTREKRTGKTGYRFYSEPYYEEEENTCG